LSNFDFDTIIIGSGVGGLTAAISLAQAGESVLVLERHSLPGGNAQAFARWGHSFCPGVHYIGELGPGGRMRRLYEDLGIANDILFHELNPDGYDHAIAGHGPDALRFDFPKGKDALADRLKARFPREYAGINDFVNLCNVIYNEWEAVDYCGDGLKSLWTLPFRAPHLARHGFGSFSRLLGGMTRNSALRWVLSAQCVDSGLPPSRLSGVLQAIIAAHFFDGAYYPAGGPKRIIAAYLRALRRLGGMIRVNAPVSEILIERVHSTRRAKGVRLVNGEAISARRVISNADPETTFTRLIRPELLGRPLRRRLGRTRYSLSVASLFVASDIDLRATQLDSGNVLYYESSDMEAVFRRASSNQALQGRTLPQLFISADSLKDPGRGDLPHKLSAFAFLPYGPFRDFEGSRTGDRPAEYLRLKEAVQNLILETLYLQVPELRGHVVACEVGTPLTNAHYTAAMHGHIYGTEKTVGNSGPFAFPVVTEVAGLFLCGHSTIAHGIFGATLSGRLAAAKALDCRIPDLPRARGQSLRTQPIPSDVITTSLSR
jgi:all-trans-retinol 13,14-reductase